MNRRDVVLTLFALGVSPLASFAQEAGRTYRLGWFAAVPRADQGKIEPYSIAFEQRLREWRGSASGEAPIQLLVLLQDPIPQETLGLTIRPSLLLRADHVVR